MNLKPHQLGKETTTVGILKESSFWNLDLKTFRSLLKEELKKRNSLTESWSVSPRDLFELITETQAKSLGLFFPKTSWAEASWSIFDFAKTYFQQLQNTPLILGPRLSADKKDIAFIDAANSKSILDPQLQIEVLSDSQSPEIIPELLLIPALACDRNGRRIGRGGGFYDRYLSTHETLACAVIHSDYLFNELPEHFFHAADQNVDFILTESHFIKIKNDKKSKKTKEVSS